MAELIEFPDVEDLVITELNAGFTAHLPGVKATTKVPKTTPSVGFCRIMRTGGPAETIVTENASIIVEGWASTESRAVRILNVARAILHAQDDVLFGVTEIGGPANLPDPTTSAIRYTATLGVRVRGTILA